MAILSCSFFIQNSPWITFLSWFNSSDYATYSISNVLLKKIFVNKIEIGSYQTNFTWNYSQTLAKHFPFTWRISLNSQIFKSILFIDFFKSLFQQVNFDAENHQSSLLLKFDLYIQSKMSY
jgi:hypothetical protein